MYKKDDYAHEHEKNIQLSCVILNLFQDPWINKFP